MSSLLSLGLFTRTRVSLKIPKNVVVSASHLHKVGVFTESVPFENALEGEKASKRLLLWLRVNVENNL